MFYRLDLRKFLRNDVDRIGGGRWSWQHILHTRQVHLGLICQTVDATVSLLETGELVSYKTIQHTKITLSTLYWFYCHVIRFIMSIKDSSITGYHSQIPVFKSLLPFFLCDLGPCLYASVSLPVINIDMMVMVPKSQGSWKD